MSSSILTNLAIHLCFELIFKIHLPQVLTMEEISTILNSSLLRMRETSTISTFVEVRNTSVSSKSAANAYEWRFILPPYFLIFMLSITGNCLVIATLASNRRMRTVTNVYLLNLVSYLLHNARIYFIVWLNSSKIEKYRMVPGWYLQGIEILHIRSICKIKRV